MDLVGQKFGHLTVVEQVERKEQPNGTKPTRWKCLCDCGHYSVVTTGNLRSGHITSCGCQKYSLGEMIINNRLNKLKIPHSKEYRFDDLVSSKGIPLRFDFALFDADNRLLALIEYQGQQHFTTRDIYFGKMQREYSDRIKKEYCKAKDIPLFEITYEEKIIPRLDEILHTIYGNLVPSPE